MSKPKSQITDATPHEAITTAAIRLFGSKGYNSTTMRDIAREVGILAGSLYAHIDSKEELLADIVRAGFEPYLKIFRGLAGSTLPPSERLRAAIVAHVNVVSESRERTFVVFQQWRFLGDADRAKAITMRRRYAQGFTQIVEDGIACGEFAPDTVPRIALFTILGALNWIPEWYSPDGPSSPDTIGNQLADMLIGGLKTRPARARAARATKA